MMIDDKTLYQISFSILHDNILIKFIFYLTVSKSAFSIQ